MKNIILLAFAVFMLAACNKSEIDDLIVICSAELSCDDEQCLFTLNNEQGVVNFLSCYDSWSIRVSGPDGGGIWYIVDEWDEDYKAVGKEVTFCGYVRENTRPLILPDPMPGSFYQIGLAGIEVDAE